MRGLFQKEHLGAVTIRVDASGLRRHFGTIPMGVDVSSAREQESIEHRKYGSERRGRLDRKKYRNTSSVANSVRILPLRTVDHSPSHGDTAGREADDGRVTWHS